MSVSTKCPECEKRIRVPRFGIRIKCPHCESVVLIAEQNDARELVTTDITTEVNAVADESFDFLDHAASDQPGVAPPDSNAEIVGVADSDSSISTKNRRTRKRRKVRDDEPPNPFQDKWYSGILRQRKILRGGEKPSSLPFKLLAVYALVVTAALAYFLLLRSNHALESLPDLTPQTAAEYRHIPADADLPPGHMLRMGESRQFGGVIVRPVRVTREPLEFTHYEIESVARPPEEPVLKLWLEFTIESGQAFQPLDTVLLTKRAMRPNQPDTVLSNTFLCQASDIKTRQGAVLNYEHPVNSEWRLKQQNIDKPFQPGNRNLCYVASDVFGYDALINSREPLVWRLQIRKGLSKNGNGVTTLVDILFNPDDILTSSS